MKFNLVSSSSFLPHLQHLSLSLSLSLSLNLSSKLSFSIKQKGQNCQNLSSTPTLSKKRSKLSLIALKHTKKSLSPSSNLHAPCLASKPPPKTLPPFPEARALDCHHFLVEKRKVNNLHLYYFGAFYSYFMFARN